MAALMTAFATVAVAVADDEGTYAKIELTPRFPE